MALRGTAVVNINVRLECISGAAPRSMGASASEQIVRRAVLLNHNDDVGKMWWILGVGQGSDSKENQYCSES